METLPPYLVGLLAILLLSAFVKIFTTLSILRLGLGLEGASFGLVFAAFSFVLSILVIEPQLAPIGGLAGVISPQSKVVLPIEETFRPFLEKQADPVAVVKIAKLTHKLKTSTEAQAAPSDAAPTVGTMGFSALASAFLLSELSRALYLGLLFIVPFLVLDLLIVNALLALGVTQLSHRVVAIPLKLLLFFAVDGWSLVTEKLLGSYIA
jgi:type III secretion protein R